MAVGEPGTFVPLRFAAAYRPPVDLVRGSLSDSFYYAFSVILKQLCSLESVFYEIVLGIYWGKLLEGEGLIFLEVEIEFKWRSSSCRD